MTMRRLYLIGLFLFASINGALAVTDEIQVYTGEIEAPGVLGLAWHNNYTPSGLKTPDFPGGLVDNHAYSSVTGMGLRGDALVRGGLLYAALFRHRRPRRDL